MTTRAPKEAHLTDVAQLGEELGVFSRRYYDWLTERMKHLEVNPGRRKILRLLLENGPMKMSQLASELQLDPKRMTKLVDLMEESGLVTRQTELGDRRAKLVCVTDKGRERWQPINEGFAEIVEGLVDGFTPEERGELLRLITTITGRMYFATDEQ
ncbi:MAG: MarR family winged helix-turn-helix transcriptional regulator [Dehalococcoidia bacterium]